MYNYSKKFNSILEASKYYNISSGHISSCCNKKCKNAGKLNNIPLIWMFYKEYLQLHSEIVS
jgi:hypothetical protein